MTVFIILLLPLMATALVCIPFKKRWAPGVTVVSCVAILILSARIALHVAAGNSVVSTLKIGLLKWIAVDGLSALILLLIAFVATTAAIYSIGYMGHENLTPWKLRLYYINYNLFIFLNAGHSGSRRTDAGLDCRGIDDAVFGAARLVCETRAKPWRPLGSMSCCLSWGRAWRCSAFWFYLRRCKRPAATAFTLGRADCRRALHAAGFVANSVSVDIDRTRNQGWPRPHAHMAAGRAQSGAFTGVRPSFRHRNFGDSLCDSATVSGDASLAQFSCRNVGPGSGPHLSWHSRIFAAAGARLQTHVRLFHRRTHGHHFSGGWTGRIRRRLWRHRTNRQPLRDKIILFFRSRGGVNGSGYARNCISTRIDPHVHPPPAPRLFSADWLLLALRRLRFS